MYNKETDSQLRLAKYNYVTMQSYIFWKILILSLYKLVRRTCPTIRATPFYLQINLPQIQINPKQNKFNLAQIHFNQTQSQINSNQNQINNSKSN